MLLVSLISLLFKLVLWKSKFFIGPRFRDVAASDLFTETFPSPSKHNIQIRACDTLPKFCWKWDSVRLSGICGFLSLLVFLLNLSMSSFLLCVISQFNKEIKSRPSLSLGVF